MATKTTVGDRAMKTWQVWFGEEAVLVNADTAREAQEEARRITDRRCGVTETECLTKTPQGAQPQRCMMTVYELLENAEHNLHNAQRLGEAAFIEVAIEQLQAAIEQLQAAMKQLDEAEEPDEAEGPPEAVQPLIAAAPDLLAACKELTPILRGPLHWRLLVPGERKLVLRIEAAIAKATE